jgi:phenylalanyl-tRNA synthetase beta chain
VGDEAPAAVEAWWALSDLLGCGGELAEADVPGLHPTRRAEITVDGSVVGAVGEVDPAVLEAYDIDERVAWFEIDLGALLVQSPDRTLTDAEVGEARAAVIAAVEQQLPARLRG